MHTPNLYSYMALSLSLTLSPTLVWFHPIIHTHSTTKLTFLLSLVYTLNEIGVLHVTHPELLFATTLAAIFIRAAGHLLNVKDMLSGPAKLLWAVASALSPGPLKQTPEESRRGKHVKVD